MISQSERALCTRVVQQVFAHLEEQDVPALWSDLEELRDTFVYSDYPFWRQWNDTMPRVVRLLYQSLSFEQFLDFPTGRNFHKFSILPALDELADDVPLDQLPALCERFDFPDPRNEKRLFQKLCEAPNEAITAWLVGWLEGRLREADESVKSGSWISTHQLADAMRILANRRDEGALAACARYARELPWGTLEWHPVTYALLDGLQAQDSAEARAILWDFVQRHDETSSLRMIGLSSLVQAEPEEVLRCQLGALKRATKTETREAILLWIQARAKFLTPVHANLEPHLEAASWSPLTRILLNRVWRQHFPLWPVLASEPRALSLFIGAFERLRWNLSGCGFSLLALFIGGPIYLWFLSRLVGEPPESRRWLDALHFLSWIDLVLGLFLLLALGNTARGLGGDTDMETPRQKCEMACAYFGAFALFLGGTLAVRLL